MGHPVVDIYPWISRNHALLAMLEEILFQFTDVDFIMSVVPDYFIKSCWLSNSFKMIQSSMANDPPQTQFHWSILMFKMMHGGKIIFGTSSYLMLYGTLLFVLYVAPSPGPN